MTEPDIDELEAQEWPEPADLESRLTHQFIDGTEMEFKVQDPEVETIMQFVSPATSGETSSTKFFAFASEAIVAPQVTLERWREWATVDKILLTEKLSTETGLDRVLGTLSDDILSDAAEDVVEEEQEKGEDGGNDADRRQDDHQKVSR